MAQILNTNMASLVAQRNLSASQSVLTVSVEKQSSGMRINRAKDDSAGLGISQALAAQTRAVDKSARNAADAISVVQAAEGALGEVSSMLQRMKELATQGANAALSVQQRRYIADEVDTLRNEVNKVADRTTFNGLNLLTNASTSVMVGAVSSQASVQTTAKVAGVQGVTAAAGYSTLSGFSSASAGDFIRVWVAGGAEQRINFTSNVNGAAFIATINASAVGFTASNVSGSLRFTANDVTQAITKAWYTKASGTTYSAALTAPVAGVTAVTPQHGSIDLGNLANFKTGTAINFTVEGRAAQTFTVTTETTLAEVRDAINANNNALGVTASISGSGSLVLASSPAATIGTEKNISGSATVITELAKIVPSFEFQLGGAAGTDTIELSGLTDVRIGGNILANAADAAVFNDLATAIDTFRTSGALDDAQALMSKVDDAIAQVSSQRAELGAQQNRLSHSISNLRTQSENLSDGRSRVIDTDYATETAQITKTQIMRQSATAMLAQANQHPNLILSLLK